MAKRESKATAIAVVSEEEQLAQTTGEQIRTFLGGLATFFARARGLEEMALAKRAQAQALTLPTNGDEDRRVQEFIRAANEDKKEVQAHWAIASTVHQLHRRLTARRDISVNAYEEAANVGNRLHNAYVEAERRRAREEDERQRKLAEDRARADRAREAAEAEARAVELEEASPDLSAREAAVVDAVVRGYDWQQACSVAGYKDAVVSAARLRSSEKIQAAVKAKQEAAALRQQSAARAAQPVHVAHVEVKPDIQRAAGAIDRTTWSCEVFDPEAFIAAVFADGSGIPRDCLMVNQPKMNEYARALHDRINAWAGCRAKSKTGVV